MKHLQIIFLAFSLLNAGYNVQDKAELLQHTEVNRTLSLDLRPKIESDTVIVIVEPKANDFNFVSDSLAIADSE
jgi:hypothetical protein